MWLQKTGSIPLECNGWTIWFCDTPCLRWHSATAEWRAPRFFWKSLKTKRWSFGYIDRDVISLNDFHLSSEFGEFDLWNGGAPGRDTRSPIRGCWCSWTVCGNPSFRHPVNCYVDKWWGYQMIRFLHTVRTSCCIENMNHIWIIHESPETFMHLFCIFDICDSMIYVNVWRGIFCGPPIYIGIMSIMSNHHAPPIVTEIGSSNHRRRPLVPGLLDKHWILIASKRFGFPLGNL